MADLERSVAIIFEGVDQMGAGVDSATKRMNSIIGSAQGVVDPVANATAGILKFEAALLAGGVAATGLAVKMAGDFDTQFREIATLIDVPIEKLGDFRSELLEYSSASTQSLDEVMQSTYNAISNGVEYTDSLETIRLAEKAAVAGKAELGDALSAIIRPIEAYGKGMDEAQGFSDMLFTAVKNGVTTLPELSASLGGVTGLAATAGISFGELLAAVATLTATGSTTSGALTQIQGAISNILKPTAQAVALADELGIEFNATALESKGLSGVLLDVQEATGGNAEQMAQLFGSTEALNGMLTLTGLGAESFAENLLAMQNSAGATEEAYDKMADSISLGNQRIANAFTAMMVGVGDPLLDEFGGIQEAIAEIFNAIGASVTGGQLQEFVGLIEGVMGSLEQSLRDVATNLPEALESADLSGFVNGFEAVRDAVAGLFGNADLSTAEGLANVIATLGSGVELLGEFIAQTIVTIGPFIEMLAEIAQWVTELDPDIVQFAGAIGGISLVVSPLLSALALLTSALALMGGSGGALPVATRAVGSMVTVLGKIAGPAGAAFLAYEAFEQLQNKIKEFNEEPITLSEKIESDLADIENIQGDEFSLFNVENLLAGYESLSQYFGWGEEAGADFEQLSEAAVAAAVKVAESASSIGGKSADDVKRISDAAVEAAIKVANAGNEMGTSLASVEIPFLSDLDDLPESMERVRNIFEKDGKGIVVSAEAVGKALYSLQEAYEAGEIDPGKYESLKEALLGLRDGSDAAAESQEALAGEVLSSEDAIIKARKAVLEHKVALEQIASDERIKKLEIGIDFKVAKMETDAKKVQAILNATSQTISSTASAASSMFGSLDNLSMTDRWDARKAISQQLEIQQKAAEQQEKLIKAQVGNLNARTQALKNGEGLIKIESDGLEPALEMIMWNVIEKVQLRANADGAEFLLGINGSG